VIVAKWRFSAALVVLVPACLNLPAELPADQAAPPTADGQFALGETRGRVVAPAVNEASGMVASRNNPGVLWVHNDSGDAAQVYALDTRGNYLGAFRLEGIQAVDCEDMALGPGPVPGVDYLYLGDIGDNDAQRANVRVYRFPEPAVSSTGGDQSLRLDRPDVLEFRYPDGPRDAETLLCDPRGGELFVVSKGDAGNRVYRCAALPAGSHTRRLEYIGSMSWPVFPSALLGAVGGDVAPNGREILIKNYAGAFLYKRPDGKSVGEALVGDALGTSVPCRREFMGESIAFDADGAGYYTLSEGQNQPLYYYARAGHDGATSVERLVSAGADWKHLVPHSDVIGPDARPQRFEHVFTYTPSAPLERLRLKIAGGAPVAVSLNGKPIARMAPFADPEAADTTPERGAAKRPRVRYATWMTFDVAPHLLPGLVQTGANTLIVETSLHAGPGAKRPFDLQLLATHGATVPEPSALWMLGPAGVALVLVYFWHRRRAQA